MRGALLSDGNDPPQEVEAQFLRLARAADISHGRPGAARGTGGRGETEAVALDPTPGGLPGRHSHPELAFLAKSNLELDRLMAAYVSRPPPRLTSPSLADPNAGHHRHPQEAGYFTVLTRLLKPELLPTKSDLLVGVHASRVIQGPRFEPNSSEVSFAWPWTLK